MSSTKKILVLFTISIENINILEMSSNSACHDTTECSRHDRCRVEDGKALAELIRFIPAAHKKEHTGKKARLDAA